MNRSVQIAEKVASRGRACVRAARLLCSVLLLFAVLAPLAAPPASARKLYKTRITLLGQTEGAGTDKLTNVENFYSDSSLEKLFTGWDPVANPLPGVSADLDLRGLAMLLRFDAGQSELIVKIPGVIDTSFSGNGSDRESALAEFEDWLRGSVDTISRAQLQDLLQAIVKESPVDPVAGNPNSLMARMVEADWRAGMRPPHEKGRKGQGVPNFFSVEPGVSYAKACVDGCMDVVTVDLPFVYDLHFDAFPISVMVDLPLAITFTESQWSILASAGLSARYRIMDGWSVTAGFRAGAAGSFDVGALAMMYSFSIENRYEWNMAGLRFGMGNQLVFIKTFDDIEIGGFALNYGLQNEVFRNGLDVSGRAGRFLGGNFEWMLFGDYSHYFGSELWAQDMGEVGASLNLKRKIGGRSYDRARFALSYYGARSYNGLRFEVELLF